MTDFFSISQTITVLDLSFAKKITDEGFEQIFGLLKKNLVDIDISWTKITDLGISHITNLQNLEKLTIMNCEKVSGKHFDVILNNNTNLIELNLRGCRRIEDIEIKSDQLRVLNLSFCSRISPKSIYGISCPNLQTLNLSHISGFDDVFVQSNKDFLFENLIALDISGTSISKHAEFLKNSSNIKIIRLNSCKNLSDYFLHSISTKCTNIEILEMKSCSCLNDELLASIFNRCHQILELDISRCNSISDIGIKELALSCALLKSIDLSWCPLITDLSLECLWKDCLFLENVKIFGCSKISRNAIDTVTMKLPNAVVACVRDDRDWAKFSDLG